MAKTLVDNSHGGHWTGPTVKLTPTDKAASPEAFEEIYDRRRAPKRAIAEPRHKLKAIDNPSLEDRMAEYGLNEEIR